MEKEIEEILDILYNLIKKLREKGVRVWYRQKR